MSDWLLNLKTFECAKQIKGGVGALKRKADPDEAVSDLLFKAAQGGLYGV